MFGKTTTPAGTADVNEFTVASSETAASVHEEVFIARQPIFDRSQQVYGYEVLFRSSLENCCTHEDGDAASLQTIGTLMHNVGREAAVGDKPAFVNITRELLLNAVYTVMPADRTVVELLDSVPDDEEVRAACRELKRLGYRLEVRHLSSRSTSSELLDLADFVKIDFREIAASERRVLAETLIGRGAALIGEKIETHEEFAEALDLGFSYVQGYFFCEPEVMTGKRVSAAEAVYLRFLQAIQQSQIDMEKVESIVKQDVSLSYQLLRYINSAALGVRHEITSVRQALTLLGERPLRKWGALLAVRQMTCNKPSELLKTCLVRARFCETVTNRGDLVDRSEDMFLLGLFSCIDAVMDMPLEDALEELPLAADIAAVLRGEGEGKLQQVYELMFACERGAWAQVIDLAGKLRRTQPEIAVMYFDALRWADELTRS